MATDDKTTINSIKRAIRSLNLYRDGEQYIGITEMARRLDLSKTTVFRIVRSLEAEGWLVQSADSSKYRLGFEILAVASSLYRRYDWRNIALEVMTDLKNIVEETVILSAYAVDAGICIEKVDCAEQIKLTSERGQIIPLHAGATGKTLLANIAKEEQERILQKELTRYTDRTLVDPMKLREELEQIRKQGYAVTTGESNEGAMAIGVPIFDRRGKLLYGLSVAGPLERMQRKGEEFLKESIMRAAEEMTRMMQIIK